MMPMMPLMAIDPRATDKQIIWRRNIRIIYRKIVRYKKVVNMVQYNYLIREDDITSQNFKNRKDIQKIGTFYV